MSKTSKNKTYLISMFDSDGKTYGKTDGKTLIIKMKTNMSGEQNLFSLSYDWLVHDECDLYFKQLSIL